MAGIISFVMAHETILSALGVAVLDLVFALNSSWASNGVLHWVYIQLQSLKGGSQPPSQPAA